MKKILAFAIVFACWPTYAWAQCTGVFPANTLCGNLSGSPAPPSAFAASTVTTPGSSTLNGLPIWANTIGSQLKDGNGQTIAGSYTWSGVNTFNAALGPTAGTVVNINAANGLYKPFSAVQTQSNGTPTQDTIGSGTGVGWNFNQIEAVDNGVNVSGFAGGSQNVNGLTVAYTSEGAYGANQAIYGSMNVVNSPNASNPSENFIAGSFIGRTSVSMNGTNTGAGAAGAIFGSGGSAVAASGATNLLNVSNEFNAEIDTGASARAFSVISLAPGTGHAVNGAVYDTILGISNISGHGVTSGILFSDYNGQQPLSSSGTLIKTQGSSTITGGIDFSSYTITGNFLNGPSGNFSVTGSGAVTAKRVTGNTAAPPTASACTGFTLATGSSDFAGKVTFTSATSCAISFGTAFTNAPFCTAAPGSAASTIQVSATTTVLTVTFGTANTSMTYICAGS